MKKHNSHGGLQGPSQRQLRVGEQMRHIISETMARGHFKDAILLDGAGGVTVTEVRPSPDLRHATAYVISLGGSNMDKILPALNENAAIFQKDINAKANLKFTPRVRFVLDSSFEKVQKLDELLSTITYSDQE
ncbi:MAG: 30S ribosome-binding factor RbfA [Alphaproteobacteria bacterium]|jgi:ribosome-binding factor A|nr:30S ribosome-binding factor RbfA [Alphaproteobacteria bacterium]